MTTGSEETHVAGQFLHTAHQTTDYCNDLVLKTFSDTLTFDLISFLIQMMSTVYTMSQMLQGYRKRREPHREQTKRMQPTVQSLIKSGLVKVMNSEMNKLLCQH